MKIIKCNCSRYIHIYSADNEKCPFCYNAINIDYSIDDSFKEQLSFLNDKLSKIDSLINESKYGDVFILIDEVLERVPNSSEIYWRKLLASLNCKSDLELLNKGKVLQNNTAFTNAIKHANENELQVYTQIKKFEDTIVNILEKTLAEKELEDKRKTNAEKLLEEYKQKLSTIEKLTQENIEQLENIEKSICEQAIDCAAIVGEYNHTLNDILLATEKIGYTYRDDITHEEKNSWEKQLNAFLEESNAESDQLKKIKDSNPAFHEYSKMLNKQRTIISEVNKNISDIYGIYNKIQTFVSSIENISKEYCKARESLHNGSYGHAKNLISQERFYEIVKQAFEGR